MSIIDRYIVTLFIKVFLICFISFAGLFVVVDAFTNLEEFLDVRGDGKTIPVLVSYYLPRVLQFFNKTAPMIALVAAIFTIGMMQRTNELTAIAAGGITKRRIVKPILIVTALILLASIANREILLPKYRNQLAMSAQDLARGKGRTIGITVDHSTGVAIRGQEVMPIDQTIQAPSFSMPGELVESVGVRIDAESGEFQFASAEHPSGYLLTKVAPECRSDEGSVGINGKPIVFRPSDNQWLKSDQLFVASKIDTLQLAFPKELARNASLTQMIKQAREPRSSNSNQYRVDLHWRILQPIFEISILLIGLPLVVIREQRNMFLSAGICLAVVLGMALVVIACHSMGAAQIVNPPALAAWIPVIVFLPIGFVTWKLLDR